MQQSVNSLDKQLKRQHTEAASQHTANQQALYSQQLMQSFLCNVRVDFPAHKHSKLQSTNTEHRYTESKATEIIHQITVRV